MIKTMVWMTTLGNLSKGFLCGWRHRRSGRFGIRRITLEIPDKGPKVQSATVEPALESWGWGRETRFRDTHLGVIMYIGGGWSIWCPKYYSGDQRPATLLLLYKGWAGGGWRGHMGANLIITAEQLETLTLGGSHLVLWAQTLCFPWFWKAFPETNSGYDNYASW